MTNATPDQLYKFATASAGLTILQTQALRWSSPNTFQSPYEMNNSCSMPFTGEELLARTIKIATSLIFNPEQPKGNTALLNAINRWRDSERFHSHEEAQTVLKDLLGKMIDQKEEQLKAAISKWQAFTTAIRVCCFCADYNNPMAWDLYGEHHQGIVIGIVPNSENGLLSAHPINYSNKRPQLSNIKEQLGSLIYNTPANINQRFSKNLLQKPDFLKNDQEWRVLSPRDSSFRSLPDIPYSDEKALPPGSIKSVYFGINTPRATEDACIKAVNALSPRPKIYKATLESDHFILRYNLLEP